MLLAHNTGHLWTQVMYEDLRTYVGQGLESEGWWQSDKYSAGVGRKFVLPVY